MSIRTILYGYEIKDGKHVIVDVEAQVVRDIYAEYINGKSFKAIADNLTARAITYYLDKTVWSKNIVSRILTNPQYAGANGYPAILSQEEFERASKRKTDTCRMQAEVSDLTALIKSKMVCACCGANIGRQCQWRGREKWLCLNGCKTDVYLGDSEVFAAILNTLNRVQNSPELLCWKSAFEGYMPSMDVIRQSREIDRIKEQPGVEFGVLSKMVLKNVEYKYECCPLDRGQAMTDTLMDKYRNLPPINELDEVLIRETVEKISINSNGTLTITFINHAEVTNNEHRGITA